MNTLAKNQNDKELQAKIQLTLLSAAKTAKYPTRSIDIIPNPIPNAIKYPFLANINNSIIIPLQNTKHILSEAIALFKLLLTPSMREDTIHFSFAVSQRINQKITAANPSTTRKAAPNPNNPHLIDIFEGPRKILSAAYWVTDATIFELLPTEAATPLPVFDFNGKPLVHAEDALQKLHPDFQITNYDKAPSFFYIIKIKNFPLCVVPIFMHVATIVKTAFRLIKANPQLLENPEGAKHSSHSPTISPKDIVEITIKTDTLIQHHHIPCSKAKTKTEILDLLLSYII